MYQRGYELSDVVQRIHKYLMAFRAIVSEYIEAGLLPTYSAGYISLDKQFGTIGINGALEAHEYLRSVGCQNTLKEFLQQDLSIIKTLNKEALAKYGVRFNTEFVPAENLGVKNAKWDKEDGLFVPRDCYNSYFYPVEDTSMTILDRLDAHAADVSQYLDGGAACHLNLEQLPTQIQAIKLIELAAKKGVPYWTTNVLCTICKDCGRIDPVTRQKCKYCGSKNLDYGTRVIGYLKPISSFSEGRQKEAAMRAYMKGVK
jgi:ribonucleoside-triphosphate reductase